MKHLSIMLSAADYCFVDQSDMLRLIDWHIQLLESKSKLSNIIVGGGGGEVWEREKRKYKYWGDGDGIR